MADKKKPETGDMPEVEDTLTAAETAEDTVTDAGQTPDSNAPEMDRSAEDAPQDSDAPEAEMADPDDASETDADAQDVDGEIAEPEVLEAELLDPDEGDEWGTSAAETARQEHPAPANKPEEPKRSGGFMGALVGGVIAAGAGFFVGQQGMLNDALGLEDPSVAIAANAEAIAALSAAMEAVPAPDLGDRIAALEGIASDLPAAALVVEELIVEFAALSERLTLLETRAEAIEAEIAEVIDTAAPAAALPEEILSDLTARIEEQAALTSATLEEARAAFADQVAALGEELASSRSAAETLLAEAQEEAAKAAGAAAVQADVAAIQIALDNGVPFGEPLNRLTEAGATVPPVLAEAAAEGVTPLVVLIETYPDAARAALAVAREGQTGTIRGFLQTQLGARSVTPRDGEDADAILSRAEAAVGEGRLGDALTELSAPPDPAKAAMADWLAAAQARAAAAAAMAELATSLTVN